MKKIYLLLIPVLFLIPSLSFAFTDGQTTISGSDIPNPHNYPYLNVYAGVAYSGYGLGDLMGHDIVPWGPSGTGAWGGVNTLFFMWAPSSFACNNQPLNYCFSSAGLSSVDGYTITISGGGYHTTDTRLLPPTPAPSGVSGLVSTASSTIQQAFGFGFENGVSFMKEQLWTIVASFLGILEAMIGIFIALIVITVIVGLIYRGFKYFKH